VKEHLIHNGRDPKYKVWRGLANIYSSNEEWEEEFRVPTRQQTQKLDSIVDMRAIVVDAFE
jgi:hypothetical protein